MVKPVFRRKSIGTKVSDEEYAQLEALAGGRAMSEWTREVLLRELDGRQARPADETLLAEVLALRFDAATVTVTGGTVLTGPLYYVEDSLGTSRVIANSSGTVCYDGDFYPFGGERPYTNTCPQNYKFEGKERDTETGNDNFGARYYSNRYGRWLSADWSATPVAAPYAYDAENHLTSTAGVTYTYDGDGKRVMKSNGTLYWYGSSSDPYMETDLSNNMKYQYFFFNGQRVARENTSNQITWYFADHLGSSRVVWSVNGSDDSDFYPFGGERVISSGAANQYKFTGKERDAESGLDNFGARYDSSSMGRFMSPDPLLNSGHPSNPQTWNRYAYTLNNPLNIVDPTGLYNLVNNCASDDKKCNKQFQQNSERLKNGVSDLQKAADKEKDPVKKARLEASLKALGTENDGNNVNVSFGALKGDAAGHTDTVYNDKTGGLSFNVTFDPSKISSQNSQAIDAAHEGTHITDISDPRYATGQLSDFSDEYRAYQTSAWAASALGLSSLSFGKNGSYPIWNSSWATVDDEVLTRYIIENYKYSNGQPYKETTPHNPWDN
jgi:RHS repeat-associated protein